MPLLRTLICGLLPGAFLLLSGCYGRQGIRETANPDETGEQARTVQAEMADMQVRMEELERLLKTHDADQSSLRATFQMQLGEINEQLRALSVQMQELMDLLALTEGGVAGSYDSPYDESPSRGSSTEWEVPRRELEAPTDHQGESEGSVPGAAADQQGRTGEPARTPATGPEGRTVDQAGAAGPAASKATDSPAVPEETGTRDAKPLYDAAYRDLTQGNYQLALMEFREYLQRFPDTDLADNSQYWMGEVFYAQSQYDQAIEEFLKVVDRYPDADKVPAAYLKTAYSFERLGDMPTARRYLRLIMDRYPDSEESRLARRRLAESR